MTDITKDTDPLELLIGKMLLDIIGPKTDQMNPGTGVRLTAQALDKFFNATKYDLTYGEELIGYDPDKAYDPALKEILLDFANAIDVLDNCKGTTPPAVRATETAIGHIQTACFWAQHTLSNSKL